MQGWERIWLSGSILEGGSAFPEGCQEPKPPTEGSPSPDSTGAVPLQTWTSRC